MFSVIIILWMAVFSYSSKLSKAVETNKKTAKIYGNNISIGIVSGVIVVIADKVITMFFLNLPKLNFNSYFDFFVSVLNALISIGLTSGIMLFSIFFLVYQGFKPRLNKSKKPDNY